MDISFNTAGIVLYVILKFAQANYQFQNLDLSLADGDLKILSQIFLGIIGSIIASLIFMTALHIRDKTALKSLLEIAPKDFFVKHFEDLKHYEGRVRHNHKAHCKFLTDPNCPDILLLNISYTYEVSSLNRNLAFKFERLTGKEGDSKNLNVAEQCLENEYFHVADETDFDEDVGDLEQHYKISNLTVDGECIELIQISHGSTIEFTADCSTKRESAQISYDVILPVEKESFIDFTTDFITKNSSIEIDYSTVAEDTILSIICHAGIKDEDNPNDSENYHIIRRNLHGWVLPQSGWMAAWWTKN